jgi:uncharacterized SAM-binding protein YcdF (DUF218 family)
LAGLILVGSYATYRIWQQGETDDRRPADAIVVLGAAQYNGLPSPVFRARLDHAIELYRAGVAPVLVVTGGGAEGDRFTEAETARAYAVEAGVPESAIIQESAGRTTLQSLRSVAAILATRHFDSAVFVSDRSHMLRILRLARDLGITGWGSPTATSPSDATIEARFDATVHELGAIAVYFATGSDRLPGEFFVPSR